MKVKVTLQVKPFFWGGNAQNPSYQYFTNVTDIIEKNLSFLEVYKMAPIACARKSCKLLKDNKREKASSNKTRALTNSTNMGICIVGTSNQLFVTGS